ncbi:MAG TPA: MerR family transcriptional regulator [Polyangiaceae bacterium]
MTSPKRMRMAELAQASGVSRDTIHYYLREGLLPRPVKGGKTVAYYDEAHLERLRLIRRFREEKYLPVAVIRRLLDSGPKGAQDRDLDTLADVLSIDPTLAREGATPELLDEETTRVALGLGLLGEHVVEVDVDDPTEARVLASVAEALALEGDARQLTLDDMQACGRELARLVEIEAGLFFDLVVKTGDTLRSVQALRAGRAAVAHFITAFRDLMLRRISDDVLSGISSGPKALRHPRVLPLSEERLLQLGARTRQHELFERARGGDAAAANDLVWHLAVVGPVRELAKLPRKIHELMRPRAQLLVRLIELAGTDGDNAELEQIQARAAPFPLGEVLLAEAALVRLVQFGPEQGSFFEHFVPALHRLASAKPDQDADPLAAAVAFHRRGQIKLLLPRVLKRRGDPSADLERTLEVVLGAPGRIDAAARARLEGNARLSLGRLRAADGQRRQAFEQLERARAIDPQGPIGTAALDEMGRLGG